MLWLTLWNDHHNKFSERLSPNADAKLKEQKKFPFDENS